MKSVDASKYDATYFDQVLNVIDYSKPVNLATFKPIHQQIARLVSLTEQDFVVDYGCGNGDLAFLLAMKYRCRVLGIDYSPDAITIANKNKHNIERTGSLQKDCVEFLCVNNENVPKLKNVSAVYLADVIEHLYDPEIDLVLKTIDSWHSKNLKLVIHTDNNIYLRFIRPLIDMISIISRATTSEEILGRNKWEQERHVNLTTASKLREKLKKYGYTQIALDYSSVDPKKVADQLGKITSIPLLIPLILFITPYISFLLPSFYSVFQKQDHGEAT